ncbi:aspartate aminotransferase family protein [uncultured Bacteroides sp.]|uniref:(R)-1-hydroxy-2-aminoethylphosphonate ammonia-lyase n=1 Tax=uncultured Bacteroides sp. TaxID=162156 RepID=UPI002AA89ED8|nr:aspartate aminotransferase family protein [uncultured Bacteroides sp.]
MNQIMNKAEGDINCTSARTEWLESLPEKTIKKIKEDADSFLHQALSTPCMEVLEECDGPYIMTSSGRKILDFHGNNIHQVGYRNKQVIDAVIAMLTKLPFSPRRYTNQAAIELAQRLTTKVPGLNSVLFAPGGSEANSMALKLARIATGKFKVVSMWGAFHGAGLDTISVGGEASFRKNIGPLLSGTEHVPQPDSYRSFWENDKEQDIYVAYVRQVFECEGDVGAFIAETIRNTDVQIPTLNFWQKIRALCDEFGVVLILDEIPIAIGRTGRFFAFEHYGIVPDIVTIGKGLGGGVFPMAALLTNDKFNIAAEHSVGHFTHEKSPLGSAAGLAVLDIIEEQHLLQRTQQLGELMKKRLLEMKDRFEMIGDVRGIGLLWGIDLVTDRITKNRAADEAEKVLYDCIKNGLSFKVSLGNVINLCPALIISEPELNRALDILENAFRKFIH